MRKGRSWLRWMPWVGVLLACNMFAPLTPIATPIGGVTALPGAGTVVVTALPGGITPLPPTYTPLPPVTTTAGCTLNSEYVADVTVPDDTIFNPGAGFRKTWRIRNSGTCNWEAGTTLVFVGGDALSGPGSAAVPAAAVGASLELSVDLKAPTAPGTYRSNWQLVAPNGTRYGAIFFAQIVVPAPATSTPVPATATPGPSPTPTPTLPAGCVAVDSQLQPVMAHAAALGINPGCAKSTAFSTSGAVQEYWANVSYPDTSIRYRSLMIWRSDTRQIYAIRGSDRTATEATLLSVYLDDWKEGQPDIPASCASMTAPSGYLIPVRGFGKVWCQNNLWNGIGYPNQPEAAVSLLIQSMEHGLLIKVNGASPYGVVIDISGGMASVKPNF